MWCYFLLCVPQVYLQLYNSFVIECACPISGLQHSGLMNMLLKDIERMQKCCVIFVLVTIAHIHFILCNITLYHHDMITQNTFRMA